MSSAADLPATAPTSPTEVVALTPDWLVDDQLAPATAGGLAELYAAAAAGELAMPYCAACNQVLELEQQICDACGAPEVAWRSVAPIGTVHSSTLVHRREPGLIRAESPYPVVDLELDSGHRVVLTTAAPTVDAPAIGRRVTVSFRQVGGVPIPAADCS